MTRRLLRKTALCLLSLASLTCGSSQRVNYQEGDSFYDPGQALVAAKNMIGKPYKYSGENPSGFDCSGLVRYSYLKVGIDLPHGTGELKEVTRHVADRELRKGDLVFFERDGNRLHVGIYVGGNRFVHAPRPGKFVRIDSLDDPYWKERFCDARRI
jgi:cell wall-associated NlpC family hydrolase